VADEKVLTHLGFRLEPIDLMNKVHLIAPKQAQIAGDNILALFACRHGPDGWLLGQARPDFGQPLVAQWTI
jgi:hypothetical protein